MSDERAIGSRPRGERTEDVDGSALAPAELMDDLEARIAELDAVAWNLPQGSSDLRQPPDSAWPVEDDGS